MGFCIPYMVDACVVLSWPGRSHGGREGSNSAIQRNRSSAEVFAIRRTVQAPMVHVIDKGTGVSFVSFWRGFSLEIGCRIHLLTSRSIAFNTVLK